ncbi:hypothetical protein HHK36_023297 [Tetracentron sinense]|uniref:Uncharacterized protein n=1 Tax=Tetracentron sinense TaxID=13715 RepID=A0A834YS41_TETSI|nr:hypothetical protein HHK36_023297 [Tetracentron sinense]
MEGREKGYRGRRRGRKAVAAGMHALPTKAQLLKKLNEDETSARIQMQNYVNTLVPVILYIDKSIPFKKLGVDWFDCLGCNLWSLAYLGGIGYCTVVMPPCFYCDPSVEAWNCSHIFHQIKIDNSSSMQKSSGRNGETAPFTSPYGFTSSFCRWS